ncbi:condensation domain-containing protein [Nocardia sp. NPDC006044]|uniref:condensation domain-containing protein n=1 Tax=Nocardia sp. NPDC006044 TaxID=3364306 RepID=UPI0036838D79
MNNREDAAAVAVIGVAFELPGCPDWNSLTALLRHGRDTMHRFPDARAEATGVARSATDREGGWIDDITGFDYRYFGLAKAEAELIDPRQRRMLHLACRAIGHAGYAPAELAGTNTAVVVGGYGAPHPSLSDLLPAEERHSGQAKTGSLHAYAAGRIAYHLDLRGAAQVVDTACSSFLIALHEARWKLARGESDLALAGGYELVLGALPQRGADGMGVLSPVDRCRPFDVGADGTTYGEGGGFVLLKPLDAALRDGDTVHAILRGSAVNQDARRGAGLTAPSPQAQTEVITAALRDAQISAAAIGYVEAHGTGTKIGDPIEIQGLLDAYAGQLDEAGPAVSSIKANVGHLGCMAAFAGLVRILAQFRAGEIFPTAHLERPNPLLDIDGAPLRIADRVQPWADGARYAAISSFGLSGTNAHMIIQAPEPTESAAAPSGGAQVIVLSARDSAGLRAQVQALHDQVAADPGSFDLVTAAAVLSLGREHFAHRHAWVVHDAKELLERLSDTLATPGDQQGPSDPTPVVVALGDISDLPADQLQAAADTFPAFARIICEAKSSATEEDWTPTQRGLIWLLGAHQVLADAGITPDLLLTHGIGATAARVARGDDDLATALHAETVAPHPPRADALAKAMAGLPAAPVIIDLAPGTELSTLLADHPSAAVTSTLADALRQLYLTGHQMNWRGVYGQTPRRRLELPVAPMAEVHCWPTVATPHAPTSDASPTVTTASPIPIATPSRIAASANGAAPTPTSPTGGTAPTSDATSTDAWSTAAPLPTTGVSLTAATSSTATSASSVATPAICKAVDDTSPADTAPAGEPTTSNATTTPRPTPEPPAPSVAEVVIALAREVLKEPALQPEDDFFDVGGTSLNGAQWVARINDRFGTDLGVLDLYDYQDLGETAAAVAELVGEGPSAASTTANATSTPAAPTASIPPAGSQTSTTAASFTDTTPLTDESLNGGTVSASDTAPAGITSPATIAGARTAPNPNAALVDGTPSTPALAGPASVPNGTTHTDNTPLTGGTSFTSVAEASTALQPHSVAETVIDLARQVLKEPGLQPEDDFFDVGGTSLNGAQWVARINEQFGTDLGVLDLYDYQDLGETASAVAELVGRGSSATAGQTHEEPTAVSSLESSHAEESPLSGQQMAIWAADRLDPDTGAYNVPAALLLDGEVDIAAVTERLRVVVARHPMLRARVVDTADGPRQVVTPVDEVRVRLTELVVDLTGVAVAEGRAELLDRLRALVAEPLSPYGPSSRYLLVRAEFSDGAQTILLPVFHHLFVDGWSWSLLFAELGGDPIALPAPERRYADYVADQQALLDGPAGTDLIDFWSEYLSGAPYVPLPTDPEPSETADSTGELALPIDNARAARLRELARRERCSLNTVLLAAWMTLLRQITGEQDVCVAFPAAGRKPIDEPVVGNYATTLVVRATVRPEQSITALLTTVRTAALRALDHQDLPTDRLRRLARPHSADPLASTMFTVTSDVEPLRRFGTDGPAVELLDVGQGGAAFPVAVTVLEYDDQLRCRLQYDPAMLRAGTIRGWADAYQALLDRLVSLAPETPVRALSTGIASTPRRRPAQLSTSTQTTAAYAAPNTALQQRLFALWSHYLRRDRIGIEDDFFDLGGDSISAIAIAADAGTDGIPLRPRYILQLRTIAAVAATITEREISPAETASGNASSIRPDEYTADPTPPQLEFLARGVPTPDHWNHGVRYTLRHNIDTDTIERGVRDLALRHPALRAQLRTVAGKWQLLPDGALPEVTEFDLTTADPADLPTLVHNTATTLHRTLNLSDGPVCRAGIFRTPPGHHDQLVLVIHHTMVDLYSWNVVTEDLSALLAGTSTAELPASSSSYFEWARRLAHLVRTAPNTFDASYWLDRSWGEATQLRLADTESFGVEGNTGELVTEFPAPEQVPGLSRAEQLLAALAAAIQHWLNVRGGEIAVQLVGHGREDLFDDLDLGRTVGYFNTTYPFALGLPGRRTPADHAAFVAEQLRSIPGRGFDFEPLRRFHPDAAIRTALDRIGTPTVQFSFWGTPEFLSAAEDPAKALTNADNELVGQDRPDDMPRPCAIEVYPMLVADRIRVQWRYSGELFTPDRILALAEAFGAASATPAPMIHQKTGVTR